MPTGYFPAQWKVAKISSTWNLANPPTNLCPTGR
jgi:hypothetical protein